jgi:hypothetical protein
MPSLLSVATAEAAPQAQPFSLTSPSVSQLPWHEEPRPPSRAVSGSALPKGAHHRR